MAGAERASRVVHAFRFLAEQRIHLTALLIAVALPLRASDIQFDPSTTQQDFQTFSRLIAQDIFPTPVQPAGASGLMRFDIGIAASAVQVDTGSGYWQHLASKNITISNNYVAVPRLVVSKGLHFVTISGSYAKLAHANGSILGGTLDVPLFGGGTVEPTLALRGSYAVLQGVDAYNVNVYGLELFLGKGFGPVTPYGSYGRQRSNAHGKITPAVELRDESTLTRYGVGVQFNVVVFRLDVEATQAQTRSYAAKISFGF